MVSEKGRVKNVVLENQAQVLKEGSAEVEGLKVKERNKVERKKGKAGVDKEKRS